MPTASAPWSRTVVAHRQAAHALSAQNGVTGRQALSGDHLQARDHLGGGVDAHDVEAIGQVAGGLFEAVVHDLPFEFGNPLARVPYPPHR